MAAFPADAFDAKGQLKAEFIETEVKRVFPEGHSLWDKLQCSGNLTLDEFAEWLSETHSLELEQWDFVFGYKQLVDEDGKKKGFTPVTARIFPANKPLDYSLVPALNLTPAEATKAIMKTPGARPQQKYEALWEACRAAGKIEAPPADPHAITPDTTLATVLQYMQAKGEQAELDKTIAYKTVSCIAQRLFWVIPSAEAPICADAESGEAIETLASIRINLA